MLLGQPAAATHATKTPWPSKRTPNAPKQRMSVEMHRQSDSSTSCVCCPRLGAGPVSRDPCHEHTLAIKKHTKCVQTTHVSGDASSKRFKHFLRVLPQIGRRARRCVL